MIIIDKNNFKIFESMIIIDKLKIFIKFFNFIKILKKKFRNFVISIILYYILYKYIFEYMFIYIINFFFS